MEGLQHFESVAVGHLLHRLAVPAFSLAFDVLHGRFPQPLTDDSKSAACFHGLELFRIANKNKLGSGLLNLLGEPRHLPRPHHARLVHHENDFRVERVPVLVDLVNELGNRATLNFCLI